MSTSQHEPTNDQLWLQPPVDTSATQPGQAVAPYTPPAATPAPLTGAQPYVRPDRMPFVIGIISLGVAIPLTVVALAMNGLPALLIVWLGIVMVNIVFGTLHRRH